MSTTAILMTDSHRVLGELRTGGERLQDLLNNKLTTCLQIHNVQVFRRSEATHPPLHFPELTLSKLLLNIVLLQEDQHEAPTKRLYGYVPKNRYQTFLTVSGYEVQGDLHFTTPPKPEVILTDTLTSFIPVTQATVTTAPSAGQSWSSSVVFVRRSAIALFRAAIQP